MQGPTSPRNFTVRDAAILVAATAIALGLTRSYPIWIKSALKTSTLADWSPWRTAIEWSEYICFATMPVGMCMTVAVLAMRLIRPRPPFRRLVRQPGTTASVAFVFSLLLGLLQSVTGALTLDHIADILDLLFFMFKPVNNTDFSCIVGFCQCLGFLGSGRVVAVAWLVLALTRSWRPEPSWIDRAGRVLGCYWIATMPFTCNYLFINMLS